MNVSNQNLLKHGESREVYKQSSKQQMLHNTEKQ